MNTEKVTVIGFKASGKTCYLAGMYDTMSTGLKKFSLTEENHDQDLYLAGLWENINYGATRQWPMLTDEKRVYNFSLQHSFDEIAKFQWLDYPGAALIDTQLGMRDELTKQIGESACLLVLVNGESFAFESRIEEAEKVPIKANSPEEYKKKVKRNLKNNKDLRAITTLSDIGKQNKYLPPIALVVTKSDLIEDQWIKYIPEILNENFDSIFGGGEDNRVVMLTAVTLGMDISYDGENAVDADPENIEQPIAFAVLSILCKYIALAKEAKNNTSNRLSNTDTVWGRMVKRSKIQSMRADIENLQKLINKYSRDAVRLLDLFEEDKPIYVNGTEQKFCEYFRKQLKM